MDHTTSERRLPKRVELMKNGGTITATFNELLKVKTVSFFPGVCLLINAMTGPALPFSPSLFQYGGIIPPILLYIIFTILATLSSLFVVEAMQGTVEFGTLVNFYFGKKSHLAAQFCLYWAVQSNAIQSIMLTAQAFDNFFIDVAGTTCGLATSEPFFRCVVSKGVDSSPFGEMWMLITFGFIAVLVLTLPLLFIDMGENILIQVGTLLISLMIVFQWIICAIIYIFGDSVNSPPHEITHIPAIGSGVENITGTIMLSLAYTFVVPSWINLKKRDVNIQTTIWTSSIAATTLYLILGIIPALAFPTSFLLEGNGNILPVLSHYGLPQSLTKISIFGFSIIMLLPSIPVSLIVSGDNLAQNDVFSKRVSSFIAYVLPWILTCLLKGSQLQFIQNWSSILFVSTANFIVPTLIYIKCHTFRKEYNKNRFLSKKQKSLLKKIHFQSQSIKNWVDKKENGTVGKAKFIKKNLDGFFGEAGMIEKEKTKVAETEKFEVDVVLPSIVVTAEVEIPTEKLVTFKRPAHDASLLGVPQKRRSSDEVMKKVMEEERLAMIKENDHIPHQKSNVESNPVSTTTLAIPMGQRRGSASAYSIEKKKGMLALQKLTTDVPPMFLAVPINRRTSLSMDCLPASPAFSNIGQQNNNLASSTTAFGKNQSNAGKNSPTGSKSSVTSQTGSKSSMNSYNESKNSVSSSKNSVLSFQESKENVGSDGNLSSFISINQSRPSTSFKVEKQPSSESMGSSISGSLNHDQNNKFFNVSPPGSSKHSPKTSAKVSPKGSPKSSPKNSLPNSNWSIKQQGSKNGTKKRIELPQNTNEAFFDPLSDSNIFNSASLTWNKLKKSLQSEYQEYKGSMPALNNNFESMDIESQIEKTTSKWRNLKNGKKSKLGAEGNSNESLNNSGELELPVITVSEHFSASEFTKQNEIFNILNKDLNYIPESTVNVEKDLEISGDNLDFFLFEDVPDPSTEDEERKNSEKRVPGSGLGLTSIKNLQNVLSEKVVKNNFVIPDIIITPPQDEPKFFFDKWESDDLNENGERANQTSGKLPLAPSPLVYRRQSLPMETLYITTSTFRCLPKFVTNRVSSKNVAVCCLYITTLVTAVNIIWNIVGPTMSKK
ncbi:hypothetical protein HK099_003152 [Clydaea vesicula]|uniref:Amino acid transporter transmembrane domain-containing protein n=1 Tax=Clydaea vesicula TaxID=447962 RepID=A0AAD5U2C3_9FUNG|nr:hypothetical protein HK099_003152 [Clydaea vesicula]